MTEIKDIYDYIRSVAPIETQEEWDNSGLMIGDLGTAVDTVVLSLDATNAVVDFAVGMGAKLVITHHPVIFGGLKSIPTGSVQYELISNGISAISFHTPYDKAKGGMNDSLASILGLHNVQRVDNEFLTVGDLETPMSIDDFALFVSDTLSCSGLRYTDCESLISRVALCTGAGDEFLSAAMDNADCYLTGDAKYHVMLEASENGFPMISAGHYETEYAPFAMIKSKLQDAFPDVSFIVAPQKNPVLAVD